MFNDIIKRKMLKYPKEKTWLLRADMSVKSVIVLENHMLEHA